MDRKVLKTLEFDKIREQLANYAASSLGKELINSLIPETDYETIVRLQNETDEAAKILRIKGHVPLDGIFYVSPYIKRAEIGGMLNQGELLEIASTIRAARILKKFLQPLIEKESLPILEEYCKRMNPPTELEKKIFAAINENGEIVDEASDKLRTIRRQIRSLEGRIREKLEAMIRSDSIQKMLSDAIITIRNDRFVIPVKQEYRSNFGGIVHDQSSSGQTLFIEPESVLTMNNEVHTLRGKEQIEIERILREISNETAANSREINTIVQMLQQIDFMFAKAKYGATLKATKPYINKNGYLRLMKARHPLIPKDQVVANDIELGKDFTTIVITGPNTGGKTVTLKTVGLLTLMAQAGLQIPALDGSEICVFQSVFADIGDEQSIEQSLSTFSSHMVNIVHILNNINESSLVLFDELGAGTDPQEGAALAMAILDEVHRRGARVIATTHYSELKAYSYNREGVINARVEFDIDTLSPTYRLSIGVPGRSNAFEISKRLGLPEHIINQARKFIDADTNQVDHMIASLEKSKKEAEAAENEALEFLQKAEALHHDLQKAFNEFQKQKDQLLLKAKEEAKAIIKRAKEEADEIIKELREMRLTKGIELKEHELIEAKKRLDDVIPTDEEGSQKKQTASPKFNFQPGDQVKVLSFGQTGYLIEKVNEHEWLVQLGILKMNVNENDLQLIQTKSDTVLQPITTIKGKNDPVGLELDLRGERYEDAMIKLEKYLDDCLVAGYSRVSIIHGKGTGALRQGVQQFLKNHRAVKSFRYGTPNEGGIGKTIVELK